jgi:hypothetical protein
MRHLLTYFLATVAVMNIAHGKAPITNRPVFSNLASSTGDHWLSMACDGEAPFSKVRCQFKQVTFNMPNEKHQKDRLKEYVAMYHEKSDPNLRKSYKDVCNDSSDSSKTLGNISINESERTKYKRYKWNRWRTDVCACNSKKNDDEFRACLGLALYEREKDPENFCTLSFKTFERTFDRVGDRKFISNLGPKGMCDEIEVGILEAETDIELWNYSQTIVSTNKDREHCKLINKTPVFFSVDVPNILPVNCKALNMDIFPY